MSQGQSSWSGALAGFSRGPSRAVSIVAPGSRSGSGARAFSAIADDGLSYWIKAPGNPQGNLVMATEQIVAGVARLLDAPVRPVEVVQTSTALVGWQYGEWEKLLPGLAHGSLNLAHAQESDALIHTSDDGNRARMSRLSVLWDWCMGADEQWLYDSSSEFQVWSFDHGWWLGAGEPDWSAATLGMYVGDSWELSLPGDAIDPDALLDAADRLRRVTANDLLTAVAAVPVEWGVTDWDLESAAWFLHERRVPVAARAEVRAGINGGGG